MEWGTKKLKIGNKKKISSTKLSKCVNGMGGHVVVVKASFKEHSTVQK